MCTLAGAGAAPPAAQVTSASRRAFIDRPQPAQVRALFGVSPQDCEGQLELSHLLRKLTSTSNANHRQPMCLCRTPAGTCLYDASERMLMCYWSCMQVPRPPAAEPCGSAGALEDVADFLTTLAASDESPTALTATPVQTLMEAAQIGSANKVRPPCTQPVPQQAPPNLLHESVYMARNKWRCTPPASCCIFMGPLPYQCCKPGAGQIISDIPWAMHAIVIDTAQPLLPRPAPVLKDLSLPHVSKLVARLRAGQGLPCTYLCHPCDGCQSPGCAHASRSCRTACAAAGRCCGARGPAARTTEGPAAGGARGPAARTAEGPAAGGARGAACRPAWQGAVRAQRRERAGQQPAGAHCTHALPNVLQCFTAGARALSPRPA